MSKKVNYSVEIVVRDAQGNVKFSKVVANEGEKKEICLAMEQGNKGQIRPSCIEWNVKELFETFQRDNEGNETSEPSRLNGEKAGFYVESVVRFVDFDIYNKWMNKPRGKSESKVATETSIEI